MLRLIILTVGLQSISFGQSVTGQIFMLTEYFVDEKCEVIAECDCCSADLFFLTDKEFGMINRCLNRDSYYRGSYLIKEDKLTLTFKQKVVNELVDDETSKAKNELKEIKIEPYQFTISKCNSKVRLHVSRSSFNKT